MSNINVVKIYEELMFIANNPEKWRQGVWVADVEADNVPSACGTYGCFAGNTVVHSGEKLDWERSGGTWYTEKTESGEHISVRARDLLGLTQAQSDLMFAGDNSYRDLWDYAIQFSGGMLTTEQMQNAMRIFRRNRVAQTENEMYKMRDKNPEIRDLLIMYGRLSVRLEKEMNAYDQALEDQFN